MHRWIDLTRSSSCWMTRVFAYKRNVIPCVPTCYSKQYYIMMVMYECRGNVNCVSSIKKIVPELGLGVHVKVKRRISLSTFSNVHSKTYEYAYSEME